MRRVHLCLLVVCLCLLHVHAAGALAVGSPRSLRLDGSVFAPADILANNDWPISPAAADTRGFRVNHWWPYSRMGMLEGYYELAAAYTSDTGCLIMFGWQASVFPTASQAFKAYQDGVSRTG